MERDRHFHARHSNRLCNTAICRISFHAHQRYNFQDMSDCVRNEMRYLRGQRKPSNCLEFVALNKSQKIDEHAMCTSPTILRG